MNDLAGWQGPEGLYPNSGELPFSANDSMSVVTSTVWWTMVFPTDFNARFESYVRENVLGTSGASTLPGGQLVEIPAAWILALHGGRSFGELEKEVAVRTRQGVTAGAYLVACRLLHDLGQPVFGNSAIEILMRASEKNSSARSLGAKRYGNTAEIHAAWKAMAPVAHLWAASAIIDDTVRRGELRPGPERVLQILQIARSLLYWGQSQTTGRGKGKSTLLDPDRAWNIPAYIGSAVLPPFDRSAVDDWLVEAATQRA